jgi:hypothetical protein
MSDVISQPPPQEQEPLNSSSCQSNIPCAQAPPHYLSTARSESTFDSDTDYHGASFESPVNATQGERQPIQSPATMYDELEISLTWAKNGFGVAQQRMASDGVMNRNFVRLDNEEESWSGYR